MATTGGRGELVDDPCAGPAGADVRGTPGAAAHGERSVDRACRDMVGPYPMVRRGNRDRLAVGTPYLSSPGDVDVGAAAYGSDVVALLLGDSYHPGGLTLTRALALALAWTLTPLVAGVLALATHVLIGR